MTRRWIKREIDKPIIDSDHNLWIKQGIIYLSSALVDSMNLWPRKPYSIYAKEDAKILTLRPAIPDGSPKVITAKAGGITKGGRPRLLIRANEYLVALNITEPFIYVPDIGMNGIITINYTKGIKYGTRLS